MLLRLAISQMIFNSIYQFSTLFINTYLFRMNHSEKTVGLYNIYLFIAWMLFFYLGFKLCERNTRIGMSLSGISSIIGISFLLYGVSSPLILGFFMGACGGLFWASYLTIYTMLGKQIEKGTTYARISILGSLPTIFVPALMGFLIERASYSAGFIALLALSAGIVAVSFLLPIHRSEKVTISLKSLAHPYFITSNIIQGFYFSFISIAAGLMVFMSGQGEARVGTFAAFYGVVTLSVNLFSGYLISNRFSRLLLLLSGVIYLSSAFIFLADWPSRIIVFNIMIAAAGPLFINNSLGIHFAYINQAYTNSSEGIVAREITFSVGRILLFTFVSTVGIQVHTGLFLLFLFTTSTIPLLVFALLRKSISSIPARAVP